MRRFLIVAVCVCALVPLVGGSASAIPGGSGMVKGRSAQISGSDPKGVYYESHLAVDPRDPRHMIAVSSAFHEPHEYNAIYVTFDGGATWRRSTMASSMPLGKAFVEGGDGAVFFGKTGTAFAVVGARVGVGDRTLVSRSTDGGRTWQEPVSVSYRDRPWMAFDTGDFDLFDGYIYLIGQYTVGTIDKKQDHGLVLSVSTDDGKTFTSGNVFVHDARTGEPLNALTMNMLVTSTGMLVEPFLGQIPGQRVNRNAKIGHQMIRLVASEDGGRTLTPASRGPTVTTVNDFRGLSSFSDPSSAIDTSPGRFTDRVYVAWSDYENGRYVVRVAHTSDFGKTWGTAVASDNANGGDPGDPAVAVNKDGVVGVIWNDRRDDPNNACWRLYGAISTDGGAHFLPNQRLSSGPSCVNTAANWQPSTWYQYDNWTDPAHPLPGFGFTAFVPVRFPNGGDTQGFAADGNGVFHTAWINGETGKLSLWQTDFSVEPAIAASMHAASARSSTGNASVPTGKIDVSQELTFDVGQPVLDFAHHVLSLSLRVVNPTTHDVRGPIDVVLAHMFAGTDRGMGLKNLRPDNTDNGATAEGTATWIFSGGPGNVLRAGAKTAARTLRFRFEGEPPAQPDGYFVPRFYIWAAADR